MWINKHFAHENIKTISFIKSDLFVKADSGDITYNELLESLGRLAKIPSLQVKREWDDLIQINQNVVNIARKYRERYLTALLSNANSPLIRGVIERYNLSNCFDELFISAEIKLIKPNANAYRYVLNKFGLPAEQAIMIDDNITNLDSAKSLGISTIHFESTTDLNSELHLLLGE